MSNYILWPLCVQAHAPACRISNCSTVCHHGTIKVAQASIIQKVVDTKFVEPKEQPEKIKAHYDELVAEIEASFAAMLDV